MIIVNEELDNCKIEIERLRTHIETLNMESDNKDKKMASLIADNEEKKIAKIEKFLQVIENVYHYLYFENSKHLNFYKT